MLVIDCMKIDLMHVSLDCKASLPHHCITLAFDAIQHYYISWINLVVSGQLHGLRKTD